MPDCTPQKWETMQEIGLYPATYVPLRPAIDVVRCPHCGEYFNAYTTLHWCQHPSGWESPFDSLGS